MIKGSVISVSPYVPGEAMWSYQDSYHVINDSIMLEHVVNCHFYMGGIKKKKSLILVTSHIRCGICPLHIWASGEISLEIRKFPCFFFCLVSLAELHGFWQWKKSPNHWTIREFPQMSLFKSPNHWTIREFPQMSLFKHY